MAKVIYPCHVTGYVEIEEGEALDRSVWIHLTDLPELIATLSEIDLDVTRERKAAASMAQHTERLGLNDTP